MSFTHSRFALPGFLLPACLALAAALLLPLAAYAALPEAKPASQLLSGLSQPSTAQLLVPQGVDYDALSVTDPLYREGSLRLLQQESRQDAPAAKPADLRDAPASPETVKPARKAKSGLKKTRVKKPVHSDPLKSKKAL